MFKIGDRVRCIDAGDKGAGWFLNRELDITSITNDAYQNRGKIAWDESGSGGVYFSSLELLKNNKKNIMSSIKEKFVLAFLGEPERSFRKTEITNGDGFLTAEGQGVFLAWLLKKNGVDFKKEVVDDLLKDLEDKE